MNKNNKIGLVAFAVALFLLASYMGWLPFTLTGYCPAGVDANGACIPRNCASDDIQCKANNVRNLCMSTLDTKCPDIRTQTILNFGYVSNAALYGCTDTPWHNPYISGEWQCHGTVISTDGACISRETNICNVQYQQALAATPTPTVATATPYPTYPPTPTVQQPQNPFDKPENQGIILFVIIGILGYILLVKK